MVGDSDGCEVTSVKAPAPKGAGKGGKGGARGKAAAVKPTKVGGVGRDVFGWSFVGDGGGLSFGWFSLCGVRGKWWFLFRGWSFGLFQVLRSALRVCLLLRAKEFLIFDGARNIGALYRGSRNRFYHRCPTIGDLR